MKTVQLGYACFQTGLLHWFADGPYRGTVIAYYCFDWCL